MLGLGRLPSILLIVADQMRADAVGYATPWVSTPNIDALAAGGIVCDKTYAQSPQCQPSRASLLTGRYPTAHRVWWNDISLPRSEITIANCLQKAGYQTAYFGKAHLANTQDDPTALIRHLGFETSRLTHDWQIAIRSEGMLAGATAETLALLRHEFFGPMQSKTWTGRLSTRRHHHDELIVEWAVDHLSRHEGPLFTVVGFHGPHPPYAAPVEFTSRYRQEQMPIPTASLPNHAGHVLTAAEWQQLKVQYYGAISWIDEGVGRLVQAAQIHAPDTIVVFTADHGDILGDHGLFSKGMYCYEGNTRVPLVISRPDRPRGGKYNHLVQLIDLMPTLLAAADLPIPPGVQGANLWDALLTNEPVNKFALSMIGLHSRLRMIRQAGLKYWIYGNEEHLYDLADDRGENVNLATDQVRLSQMRLNLLRALILAEDPLPQPRA